MDQIFTSSLRDKLLSEISEIKIMRVDRNNCGCGLRLGSRILLLAFYKVKVPFAFHQIVLTLSNSVVTVIYLQYLLPLALADQSFMHGHVTGPKV